MPSGECRILSEANGKPIPGIHSPAQRLGEIGVTFEAYRQKCLCHITAIEPLVRFLRNDLERAPDDLSQGRRTTKLVWHRPLLSKLAVNRRNRARNLLKTRGPDGGHEMRPPVLLGCCPNCGLAGDPSLWPNRA